MPRCCGSFLNRVWVWVCLRLLSHLRKTHRTCSSTTRCPFGEACTVEKVWFWSIHCGPKLLLCVSVCLQENMPSKCVQVGCSKVPNFGSEGETASFCGDHRQTNMVDVRSMRCGRSGCSKSPSFGVEGGPRAFCKEHRETGMVDVVSKRCRRNGCRTRPCYGVPGLTAKFCGMHKESGMVDIVSKRCRRNGCPTRPYFGVPGGTSAFCAKHKQLGMVNVKDKHCGRSGCFKIASFGAEGSRAAFCSKHKQRGMVNVRYRPSKSGKRKRVAREEDDCGSDSDSLSGGNDSEPQQHFSVSAERARRLVFSPSAVSHNPSSKRNQIYI